MRAALNKAIDALLLGRARTPSALVQLACDLWLALGVTIALWLTAAGLVLIAGGAA